MMLSNALLLTISHPVRCATPAGIKEKNLDKATDAKSAIEDAQRQRSKEREEKGEPFKPRFFVQVGEKFVPKLDALPSDLYRPEKAVKWFEKRMA